MQPKFKLYRTYFFKVRKVYEKVKREQHLKKDRSSKGGKVLEYKDANAINGKDVYCFAVLVATSHHTFAKKTPEGVAGGAKRGIRGSP